MDTLGLVWGVLVVGGHVSEAAGAKQLLARVKDGLTRWQVVWVDGGYEHRLEDWVAAHCAFRIEVVKRSAGKQGWQLLPKRWVVERTFGWLVRHRRLVRDYEQRLDVSQAMIHIAMGSVLLRRLFV